MIDDKTRQAVVSIFLNSENLNKFVKRYQKKEIPDLDDVRFGFARVDTRGFIKWISWKKLTKKQKKIIDNSLLKVMAFPLRHRLNYADIINKCFIVEPMKQGVVGYYEKKTV